MKNSQIPIKICFIIKKIKMIWLKDESEIVFDNFNKLVNSISNKTSCSKCMLLLNGIRKYLNEKSLFLPFVHVNINKIHNICY